MQVAEDFKRLRKEPTELQDRMIQECTDIFTQTKSIKPQINP